MLDERFKLKCKLMATLRAGTWKPDGRENGYFELDLIRALQAATDIMSMAEKTESKAEKKPEPQHPTIKEKLRGDTIRIQRVDQYGVRGTSIPVWAREAILKEGIGLLANNICMRFPASLYSRVAIEEQAYLLKQLGL
jgi:hypothetical protein